MTVVLIALATFIAAAVEWVEALTIILAVGLFKSWRSALLGMVAALVTLGILVLLFGRAVTSYQSIGVARTVVGVFLLLFGLRWLHKAILRSAGLKSQHDEAKAFAETRDYLTTHSRQVGGFDWIGASTAFNGVFLEGLEVVFIVVALGGLHNLGVAAAGGIASGVAVAVAGVALRAPLTRVPENAMKYTVGIMLTSFGTFFAGEGIGVTWWREDLSLLPLIAFYALLSFALVQLLKRPPKAAISEIRVLSVVRSVVREVWGLFVDDGALAIVTVAVVLAISLFIDRFTHSRALAALLLVAGVVAAMLMGISGSLRQRAHVPEPAREEVRVIVGEEDEGLREPAAVT